MPRLFSFAFTLVFILYASCIVLSEGPNCSCGYYDASTNELFTDSIIVYFNETESLPDEFVIENYQHVYEKDWNAIYRQGADPSNVHINTSDSLQLSVSPPTDLHLVNGGVIRTARRDIQYGSFRSFIKSPSQGFGGSAASMMWQYNETEVAELSVMNTNDPSQAWIGTFVSNEFTTRDLGVNYSTALQYPAANRNYTVLGGGLDNGSVNIWDYTEYRIDWTKDSVNFYVGGNLTRSVRHDDKETIPSVPAPVYFKHWSTGNLFSMEGPPTGLSVANIAWIRMFFNSTSRAEDNSNGFNAQCSLAKACSMDNISLRNSTPYSEQATMQWKQDDNKGIKRKPALWISIICMSISVFLLIHAMIRRTPWRRRPATNSQSHAPVGTDRPPTVEQPIPSKTVTSHTSSATQISSGYSYESRDSLAIELAEPSSGTSDAGGSNHDHPSQHGSIQFDSRGTTPQVLSPYSSNLDVTREQLSSSKSSSLLYVKPTYLEIAESPMSQHPSERTLTAPAEPAPEDKIEMTVVTESALPAPRMTAHPPPPRERIDYLAGLVALCAILVTVMHFGLTFVPAMVIPDAPAHYKSEYWAQQIIAPFILNQMWLGVFFTTSVRFLVSGYLKRGNMQDIAKAAVRRTPRLMIPVASIAMLEYFFIDCGATKYLQYIPSITWSTWPYVTRFPTAGHFVSEVLELIFVIPNAVPQITFNYCTGVLWTIAVQLQGTWLVLCGVIVIYEIKTPWKRMTYYAFCVLNHWYAQSWGSYLWLGMLLTDLDVTFKYKKYLHARPLTYYPLITFFWLCVLAGFSANIVPNWINFNFPTYERNIHPDAATGEPIVNTQNAGYPAYFIPRLNGLLFAAGMQAIVELSPAVQWALSLPFLLVLFPHIFTIYLLHGLVFWSWGSWLLIFLAERDFSFGVNVAVVGVTSYVLLFATLPIITPIVEALGKDITALIWMSAIEKPPPRRRTLFPFPEDLFTRRHAKESSRDGGASLGGSSGRSTPNEKSNVKGKVKEIC